MLHPKLKVIYEKELKFFKQEYNREQSINLKEILAIRIKELELELEEKLTDDIHNMFMSLLYILRNQNYRDSAIPWYRYQKQKTDFCKKFNLIY